MAIHDAGMFTVKKTNRLKILQDVIDRNLRPGQAAEMLSITPRHCSRLLKRYRQLGPLGMNNHSRGRVGNRLFICTRYPAHDYTQHTPRRHKKTGHCDRFVA